MRIVLDTNVLVSGLLSADGPPGRIIDLVAAGRVVVLYDDRILFEYREVLARPRLGIQPDEATAILEVIEREGLLLPGEALVLVLPDQDDLPFVEVAVSGAAEALVTGNLRHFRPIRGEHDAPIHSPADFLKESILRQRS